MRIKQTCVRWLEKRYEQTSGGVLINEFSSNRSKARADLAYVSPTELVAFEIKSSNDKISRLERQIAVLKNIYNRVEVISTKIHYDKALSICSREHIGFHLIDGEKITTIRKGRHRKISDQALKNKLFPLHIQRRRDFEATEEYYRCFLMNRYRSTDKPDRSYGIDTEISASYIRNLNPHHIQRLKAKEQRESYRQDLEALFHTLQSTHSSSNSSAETSTP